MCGCNLSFSLNDLQNNNLKPNDIIKCTLSKLKCENCQQGNKLILFGLPQTNSKRLSFCCFKCTIQLNSGYDFLLDSSLSSIYRDIKYIKKHYDKSLGRQEITKLLKTQSKLLHNQLGKNLVTNNIQTILLCLYRCKFPKEIAHKIMILYIGHRKDVKLSDFYAFRYSQKNV